MAKNNRPQQKQYQLRIIGGTWRGRVLTFPDVPGLRPTSDRIRETLFNWLQGDIAGARCLDLFSGSGALGLEALSRGAKQVVFVDSQKKAMDQIKANASLLKASNADYMTMSSEAYCKNANEAFDVVFLDPPFHQGLLDGCLSALIDESLLSEDARVYVEGESPLDEKVVSESWEILKSKSAGKVYYYLLGRKIIN